MGNGQSQVVTGDSGRTRRSREQGRPGADGTAQGRRTRRGCEPHVLYLEARARRCRETEEHPAEFERRHISLS